MSDNDKYQKFSELCKTWKEETFFTSSVFKKCTHPAYKSIFDMGLDVVPFIINDLKENGPDDWFWALSEITGKNPISEEIIGNMQEMANSWIQWAKNNVN